VKELVLMLDIVGILNNRDICHLYKFSFQRTCSLFHMIYLLSPRNIFCDCLELMEKKHLEFMVKVLEYLGIQKHRYIYHHSMFSFHCTCSLFHKFCLLFLDDILEGMEVMEKFLVNLVMMGLTL